MRSIIKIAAVDLDGVIYAGNKLLPYAAELVEALRQTGVIVKFVTNNSSSGRVQLASKLTGMGITAEPLDVLTSIEMVKNTIHTLYLPDTVVNVIGSPVLEAELEEAGCIVENTLKPDCLVVGMKSDFGLDDIDFAINVLKPNLPFIVCNKDANYPGSNGELLAGCGAIVAAIEAASGLRATTVAGKPNTLFLHWLQDLYKVGRDEILVIGDSLDSDIAMANKFGSPSVFVGDPKSTISSRWQPTTIVSSLFDLFNNLDKPLRGAVCEIKFPGFE